MSFPSSDHLQLSCPKHGDFMALVLFGGRRDFCPRCVEEQRAREDARRHAEAVEHRAASELRSRLSISGLVGRFARATLDSFVAEIPAQAEALQACRNFAQGFKPCSGGGLWLIGPPGTGKTHLGSAVVAHVIRTIHHDASIHAVHEIMRMLREGFGRKDGEDRESTDDLIRRLGTQALLVLDEIGVARDSEWQREQLFAIVDERYRLERPTIVISNLSMAELKQVLGDRVYDRLREGAQVVPCAWPSHRGSRA